MLYKFDPIGVLLSNWRVNFVFPFVRGKFLVDLACGDNRLVKKIGFGVGVDITNYGSVDMVLDNFKKLPFSDSEVTTITSLASLNYFDDLDKVLVEIKRVLANDGVFLVTLLNKNISYIWHKFRDRDLNRIAYGRDELTVFLDQAGLEIYQEHSFMLGLNKLYLIKEKT